MKIILTAVVFFFVGKYFEQIKDWWNSSTDSKGLGDN